MDSIFKHLDKCLEEQLQCWPAAREAFHNLEQVQTRVLSSSGLALQHNPARIISTTANVKPAQVTARACFLCNDNRPQEQIAFDAGDGFDLLVNPYPILREHFCVVSRQHRPQMFRDCYDKMLLIARDLEPGYMIFYNGPRSGASAPDHLHMQIGRSEGIPLVDKLRLNEPPATDNPITIQPFGFPVIVMKDAAPAMLWEYVSNMTIYDGEYEPRMNVLAFNRDGQVITAIIPRSKHRPDCYYAKTDKIMVSPGAVDMFGLVITPRREDFDSLTERQVLDIYRQVTPQQPKIKVGIMAAKEIRFCLNDSYTDGRSSFEGEMSISAVQGRLSWNGILIDSLNLKPNEHGSTFTLHDVTIGIGFHWERREEQTFSGQLRFIIENGLVRAINILPVEDYLTSVISSEMKPTASREFLRAHAVISRSWVLAQLRSPYSKSNTIAASADSSNPSGRDHILNRIIKWYDHDQHTLFDVCADDHCQRYQGRTRIISAAAQAAVKDTFGQTLVYDGHLCDARFSKCCGGVTEQFETCWQDEHKPYLVALRDSSVNEGPLPDLTIHDNARQWILSEPKSFCNSADANILKESLNGYDLETPDYYRWRVEYTIEQISDIFRRKSGQDIGQIIDLRPIKRGPSGRIYELEIEGTNGTVTIGKELEIRRTLSESHLFSSAFVVEKTLDESDILKGFVLHGAGWGHGAGLCQIGAAVMATKGYTYREILQHYYPGTVLGRYY